MNMSLNITSNRNIILLGMMVVVSTVIFIILAYFVGHARFGVFSFVPVFILLFGLMGALFWYLNQVPNEDVP